MAVNTPPIDYADFVKIAPDAHAGLMTLGASVDAQLDKALTELIKLRVSQLNGCAFCIQFHLNVARKIGVDDAKLDLIAAWRDARVFDEREKAALAWAERLTSISPEGVPTLVYADVRQHFTEAEMVFLAVTIGAINAWNRLGLGLGFSPLGLR